MKLKVYVLRHTESIDNKNHIFSGDRDVELTDKGVEQAQKLAAKLKDIEFNFAFTSPLQRCVHTLQIILESQHQIEVVRDERLEERDYGLLEGHSKDKFARGCFPLFKVFHRSYWIAPPGGESLRDVQIRVKGFMKDFEEAVAGKEGNVVICTHGNAMRGIRQYFEGFPDEQLNKIESGVGEVFEYEIDSASFNTTSETDDS